MANSTEHPHVQGKTPAAREATDRTTGLYARDAGDGNAVVLIHAVPFNSLMYQPQLDALAGEVRIIAPDLPGFGLSPMREIRSLSDYAEAVVFLLDRLGVNDVVVAGVSSGAYVAFDMIAPLGNRLKGLVIAGAVATPSTEQSPLERHRLAAEVESGGLDAASGEYIPMLLGWGTQRSRPGVISRLKELTLENTPQGVAAALRAIADRPDFSSILPEIRCPVLCLAGAEDPLTPPELVREMADRMPVSRVEIVAGAGHLVNVEAPEVFNRELAKFLADTAEFPTPPGVDYNGNTRSERDANVRRR